jgi:hypothetical protein
MASLVSVGSLHGLFLEICCAVARLPESLEFRSSQPATGEALLRRDRAEQKRKMCTKKGQLSINTNTCAHHRVMLARVLQIMLNRATAIICCARALASGTVALAAVVSAPAPWFSNGT